MDYIARPVICPRCKTRVATYDGRSTTDVVANCRKCKVRVIYRIGTQKIELKPIPPRDCSSGVTFR